ncbi:MAG: aminoacyl-histidine dipeptidase [Clostridia bacterium]|nr:aminoacyl-histidine dipeptidase [Clostridia bacterium]
MSGKLKGIEPKGVMKYFEKLCDVPRGSGKTQAATAFCVDFAKEHRLEYYTDETGNVVIYKKGSPGFENSEPVIIQGHLDMVCEKAPDVSFDFETEGLKLAVDGDYINASGTTLGGDDGIAVAMALAILEDDSIKHPPIEAVFTVDEETGMFGAAALDTSVLKGRKMLNIDSEEEGTLLVSCAGGVRADVIFEAETALAFGDAYTVTITGLHGGHSGTEIDKGYISANKLMAEVLGTLLEKNNIRLCSVNGGTMDNAITRECKAVVTTPDRFSFVNEAKKLNAELMKKHGEVEAGINLFCAKCDLPNESFDKSSTVSVIGLLKELPQGVISMSKKIDGMVETSLNMGVLKTEQNKVTCVFAVRSSVDSKKENLVESIKKTAAAYGATVRTHSSYPAWEFVENSPLQKVMSDVYMRQYGKKMNVTAIHAGLECGIFCGKIKGLDCVSFGPDILEIHTPRERLSISSVERVWKYLLAVLEELCGKPTHAAVKKAEKPVKETASFTTKPHKHHINMTKEKMSLILLAVCVSFMILCILFSKEIIRLPVPKYPYKNAVAYIEQGNYEAAYKVLDVNYTLEEMKNIDDALALYKICSSHVEYKKGNLEKALSDYRQGDRLIRSQSPEVVNEIKEYGSRVREEYESSLKQKEAEKRELQSVEEERKRKEEEEKRTEYSTTVKTEERYTAPLVIFDTTIKRYYYEETTTEKKYNSDVDEFGDAEDFYDWYYDDFYDYEEAEEYFDEYY